MSSNKMQSRILGWTQIEYQNRYYNIDQKDEGTQDCRGRDGGTNFILRIKEQEAHLTLLVHDDDDDDDDEINKEFDGFGRKLSWSIRGTILKFYRQGLRETPIIFKIVDALSGFEPGVSRIQL